MVNLITVAQLPSVQRTTFLARVNRRVQDPAKISTLKVEWAKMIVTFASDAAVSAASVQVEEDICLADFAPRLECLLDMALSEKSQERVWMLDYVERISRYGSADSVRRSLFEKIESQDATTGETRGALKCKRRSGDKGVAKLRLLPQDDLILIRIEDQSAQGLKAVWKSVLSRLQSLSTASAQSTAALETNASSAHKDVWQTVLTDHQSLNAATPQLTLTHRECKHD